VLNEGYNAASMYSITAVEAWRRRVLAAETGFEKNRRLYIILMQALSEGLEGKVENNVCNGYQNGMVKGSKIENYEFKGKANGKVKKAGCMCNGHQNSIFGWIQASQWPGQWLQRYSRVLKSVLLVFLLSQM
jgi:hypothetical protein